MDYLAALARWQELKTAISHMQQEERALREGLFYGTFPDPTEGTNRYVLPDGRTVVGTFKLNRRVLEDELPKVLRKLKMKKSDAPVKTKVELVLSAYRELSDEQRRVFDQALEIKPALPTLEVVAPDPQPA